MIFYLWLVNLQIDGSLKSVDMAFLFFLRLIQWVIWEWMISFSSPVISMSYPHQTDAKNATA